MLNKIFKYLIMALSIYLSVKYIPENAVQQKELLMIAAIGSITFALIDMVSPSVRNEQKKPLE